MITSHHLVFGSKQRYRFLLDEVPNAIRAHSVFKLSSTYTGACLRSVVLNADIGFVNNLIDIAAVTPNDDTPSIWYDQTLNANATTIAGRRPIIKTGGSIRILNGLPAFFFNNTAVNVSGQTQSYITGGGNIFRNTGHGLIAMVLNSNSNLASERVCFATTTSAGNVRATISIRNPSAGNQGLSTGGRRLGADSFQSIGTSAFSANQIIVVAYFNWANAELTIWENNVMTGTRVFQTAGVTQNDAGSFFIGSNALSTANINGHIQECVIWQGADAQNAAANVSTIFSNINSRYNTY